MGGIIEHMYKIIKISNIIYVALILLISILTINLWGIIAGIVICSFLVIITLIWIILHIVCFVIMRRNKTNKIKSKVIMMIVILTLSSLNFGCIYKYKVSDYMRYLFADRVVVEKADDIAKCIIKQDVNGIRRFFCWKYRFEGRATTKSIKNALNFIDGEIVSYTVNSGSGGSGVDGHIVTELFGVCEISLITDKDNTYEIRAYYQIIDSKHRFEEGIQGIYITKVADAQGELDNDKKESVEIK